MPGKGWNYPVPLNGSILGFPTLSRFAQTLRCVHGCTSCMQMVGVHHRTITSD